MRIIPSSLPVATVLLSGENATALVEFTLAGIVRGIRKRRTWFALFTSHRHAVSSELEETKRLPSGEKAILDMELR